MVCLPGCIIQSEGLPVFGVRFVHHNQVAAYYGCIIEILEANITGEWFVPRVDTFMSQEGLSLGEAFPTHLTEVILGLLVDLQVCAKGRGLLELFTTYFTLEIFPLIMHVLVFS